MDNLLLFGVLVISILYSTVGHGGASGYLALAALLGVVSRETAQHALVINLVVAGLALIAYVRAQHFELRLALPFVIGSAPFAFLGGRIKVSTELFEILLASSIAIAALFLAFRREQEPQVHRLNLLPIAVVSGAGIGFVSGLVGIGGGIILSPLLILSGISSAKKAAAASAFFIVINSVSGLVGRSLSSGFSAPPLALIFVAAVGSVLGASLGASTFANPTLRRALALVMILASVRLLA